MSLGSLSTTAQDYLKVIWNAQEWSDTPASTTWLARRLGVRNSTVSDTLKRLAKRGLIEHSPYGSIALTDVGRAHAIAMVRRHRLIETFLVEILNYGWDEVHDEAEILEHAASEQMIERIDKLLGHPTRDPHGDPIPSVDGATRMPEAIQLTEIAAGQPHVIVRISDADPQLLRHFQAEGLILDTVVTILAVEPFSLTISIVVDGVDQTVALGTAAAAAVWVSPLPR